MKKKTIILVDGENVSEKNAERIVAITDRLGSVAEKPLLLGEQFRVRGVQL